MSEMTVCWIAIHEGGGASYLRYTRGSIRVSIGITCSRSIYYVGDDDMLGCDTGGGPLHMCTIRILSRRLA